MTLAILGLVLIGSLAHAVWNIAAKTVVGKGYAFVLSYHSLSAILLAPIAIWLVASGSVGLDGKLLAASALSALFHIAYSVTLQHGYDRAPLSIVYPTARGTGPVVTIIIAVTLLGERPGGIALLGALIVLAGIAVVTINPGRKRNAVSDERADGDGYLGEGAERVGHLGGGADGDGHLGAGSDGGGHLGAGSEGGGHSDEQAVEIHDRGGSRLSGGMGRGLSWGLLTGAFIASYTLWDDFSVNHVTASPLLYFAVSEVFVGLIMTAGLVSLPGGAARRADVGSVIREHRAALLTVALLSPLAYLLVLFAMQVAPVSLVAPVRETSIIVGTLLAWWLFNERNIATKIAGAAIVVAGIGLIALG